MNEIKESEKKIYTIIRCIIGIPIIYIMLILTHEIGHLIVILLYDLEFFITYDYGNFILNVYDYSKLTYNQLFFLISSGISAQLITIGICCILKHKKKFVEFNKVLIFVIVINMIYYLILSLITKTGDYYNIITLISNNKI